LIVLLAIMIEHSVAKTLQLEAMKKAEADQSLARR